MTTATATPPETTPPAAEAEKVRPSLFKFATFVHVGEGAEDCDHAYDGKCQEEAHFHAWCRLANPYQVQDIMEKAQAAKARRMRMYRDPESDVSVILQDDLEEIRESGARDILVDEILDRDFQEVYTQAVREVDDIEDDSAEADDTGKQPKLYVNIDQDREEYERQAALPEDKRGDDFPELEKTIARHAQAIEDAMKAIQEPRRQTLMEKSWDDLLEVVKRHRIEDAAGQAYLTAFNLWQTYVCTYRPAGLKSDSKPVTPKTRYFKNMEELRFETPTEVVKSLQETFQALEREQAKDRLGKG